MFSSSFSLPGKTKTPAETNSARDEIHRGATLFHGKAVRSAGY
jgi:hypothetical protein